MQRLSESEANKRKIGKVRPFPVILYYTLFVIILSVSVVFAAGRVDSLWIGIGLAFVLIPAGFLVLRIHRYSDVESAIQGFSRWGNIMPCYLSILDRDLRILEINTLFRNDLGNVVGQFCYQAYKNRDSACENCPVEKTFQDGKDHSSEQYKKGKNREQKAVLVTSTPIYGENGELSAVMEMATDMEDVHELRGKLEKSRQDFKELFDAVPCYITIQDKDFNVISSNRLFREDFGEQKGNLCYQAYKNRSSVCVDCPVKKTFMDGEIHSSEETVITKHGRQGNMIVYSMPIRDDSGNITAVMEVSTNITRVKDLQRQLAMIGLAVTGMAHRIKNVVMGLEGGIFIVNNGFEENNRPMIEEGWEMVQRNVSKIARIARDLLFCSKERVPDLKEGISPRAIAKDVYMLFRDRAEKESIAISLHLGLEEDTGVFDEEGIQNLLTNLVSNAIDACRFDLESDGKQHEITLRCERDLHSNVVRIEVSDNGSGITEDDREKVFESFFSSKGTEGTGLGLLVVQKVVKEHGGTITFDSRELVGTTFRVEIPYIQSLGEEPRMPKTTSGFIRPVQKSVN